MMVNGSSTIPVSFRVFGLRPSIQGLIAATSGSGCHYWGTGSSSPSISKTSTQSISWWPCNAIASEINGALVPITSMPSAITKSIVLISNGLVASSSASSTTTYGALRMATTTLPIARSQLIDSTPPLLVLNLSFTSPWKAARWKVANITINNGIDVPSTSIGSNSASWSLVVLRAPVEGWVSSSTPLLTDRTIDLLLTMTCDGFAGLAN
ncbi:Hypothetical protein, putative [Bodo saltans]|uniref:Uncharacterized protein n=1 Tax=Bodo saltans TaxID=75058 RepID=A0A0S4J409_BODSA|nr:Hypothetical protein, putative [Bodo saltans]|eukprot:CUG78395.1 Hypothetical protein, putative [Bodo saltans]